MRVLLQINADWRLCSDRYCHALERRIVPSKGLVRAERTERWKAEDYYLAPHEALSALWHIQARAISADSIEELAEAYREAGERFSAECKAQALLGSP